MRTLTIIFCVTAGLVMGLTTAARAAIIVQDNFSGAAGPPDAAKWSPPSDYGLAGWDEAPLNGSGQVNLNTTGDGLPELLVAKPIFSTAPTVTDSLRLTIAVVGPTVHLSYGFADWTSHVIELRNDGYNGATPGDWSIYMSNDGNTTDDIFDTGVTATSGTWVFNWTTTEVTLLFNSVLVFDSAVNAPTINTGPAGWQMPTAAMVPMAYTYGGAPSGAGLVDNLVFETVTTPEPASMGLLLLGGAALLGRRRKM